MSAAAAALAEIRRIMGAPVPDPWHWKWRNEVTAQDRDNLLYFAGVPAGNRRSYAQGQWSDLPPELREEIRVIARGFDSIVALERAGRIQVLPKARSK
jgi:hypothetical protein